MFGIERVFYVVDFFRQNQQFRVSSKTGSLPSVIGGLFGMTIIALSLKYTIERWHFLVNHQGQTISYL
jgi:hypothetical protein